VVSGDEDTILDDVIFFQKYVAIGDVRCKGIIINKVANLADFCDTRLPKIKQCGVDVLGVIPFYKELPYFSVSYLADRLFAKIITGEENLNQTVKQIFIGTMSVAAALNNPLFQAESKVVITSGDRSDMITAALDSRARAVILTNNILPPPDLSSKAEKLEIPLLLVSADTYEIAKQIEGMESLPTKDDQGKIDLIEKMARTHINLHALIQP
jgi:uncharacterized protein